MTLDVSPPDFPDSTLSRNMEIGLWFEKVWAAHRPVSIEACLAMAAEPDREELLEHLLQIDITLGIRHHALPPKEDYFRRFPEHRLLIERTIDKLLEQSFIQNGLRIGSCVGSGKYVIKEQLGKGGMGVVYRAFDPNLGRPVAIKFIAHKLRQDNEGLTRFLDEIKLLGRIPRHENVVGAYSCDQDAEGTLFLVMEFIEGTDLADYTNERRASRTAKGLSPEETCDFGIQIAKGLNHLHKNGVIHLDIKPANVMLDKSGVVRICDLGLGTLIKIETQFRSGTNASPNANSNASPNASTNDGPP